MELVLSHCGNQVTVVQRGTEIWFCGCDVGRALNYTNPRKVVVDHVDEEDRLRHDQLAGMQISPDNMSPWYINESGLYSLILRSTRPEARIFKRWVTSEVLPALRSTGSYERQNTRLRQIQLLNETDLHIKVVEYIRTHHPSAIIVPGLGEMQDTQEKRIECWRKGYTKGTVDLLILNRHSRYTGLALEFKTPAREREASDAQIEFLERLRRVGYQCIVSNSYDEILTAILLYFQQTRIVCQLCRRLLPSEEALAKHRATMHAPDDEDAQMASPRADEAPASDAK